MRTLGNVFTEVKYPDAGWLMSFGRNAAHNEHGCDE